MFFAITIFIITLLVLVVIHELGHFLVAKKFNIRVLEFGFGIPPKAFGKRIGETLVSINWLPFGGFVRLLGEDEIDKKVLENKRSFAAQTVGKRITVVVAGVVMNLLLAWALFYLVLGFQGFRVELPLLLEHQFFGVNQQVESIVLIQKVNKSSPADQAGLKLGERIMAVNDQFIKGSQDLSDKTKSLAGKEIKLTLSDSEKKQFRIVNVIPRERPPTGEGPLGVTLAQIQLAQLEYQTSTQKFLAGPIHSWNLSAYSGRIFGRLLGESFKKGTVEPVSESLAGPVGITQVVDAILRESRQPLLSFLNFIGILSLNLAVLNILPFPALDGGRLFFLLVEVVTRRRVHMGVEKWVHTIGMAILLTLMILVTFSDIRKIFG